MLLWQSEIPIRSLVAGEPILVGIEVIEQSGLALGVPSSGSWSTSLIVEAM